MLSHVVITHNIGTVLELKVHQIVKTRTGYRWSNLF